MITCTRRVQFCCGHRVVGHENKCARLHGHNYVAFFTCEADALDAVGRVVDFSVIKAIMGGFIESTWDHRFLAWDKDPQLDKIREAALDENDVIAVPFNPTAENMAQWLLDFGQIAMTATGVRLVSVRVWETENCYADATLQS